MLSLTSKCEHTMQKYALIECQTFLASANILWLYYRVRMGPGKPGKSWNFTVVFSRSGKSWKRATGPGKCWKFVKLKWEIWNVWETVRRINNEILGLQALLWILESWKNPGNLFWEKGTNPDSSSKGLYMHIDTGRGQFLWRSLQCAVFFAISCAELRTLLNFKCLMTNLMPCLTPN